VSLSLPADTVVGLLLASVRIVAWLLVAPPFSHRGIPVVVKVMLAVAIGLAVAPSAGEVPPLDAGPLSVAVAVQVVVGGALGFLCMLVFTAVQAAGDLVDLFGGFTLAQAFDPLMQSHSAVFGRVFQLTALTLLFVSDGHLLMLQGLLRTFDVLPLDGRLDTAVVGSVVTDGAAQLMLAALQVAGPLVAVLFLADVGLGLLTRVAPALNAFALGFPLKIFMTLALVGLTFVVLPGVVDAFAERAAEVVVRTAGG
jgi:flagellar biosynthetic protein FliR